MFVLRSQRVLRIEENGLALALVPDTAYQSTTKPLLRGDRILLYTDGILEAAASGGEEFGYDRFSNLLEESWSMDVEQTADLILEAVNAWSPTQNDDLTLIVCDYKHA
jgi:sigma-B regulation protein RsbU (phosphoserine phosphatase)